MTGGDRVELKLKVLEACYRQQNHVLQNLKVAMDEAADSAEEYGLPKDLYDATRNQLLSKRDMFASQYQKVAEQLDVLKRIDGKVLNEKVKFGSIVITSGQRLFIAAGIGKVSVDGKDYQVISPMVPYFNAIEGKKKGDEFEFRGKKDKIEEVF